MSLKKHIGSRIKEFRIKRGMNQEQLADLLGTTKQSVSRYENGERQANQDALFQLSSIFNVSIDDFFPSENQVVHLPMFAYNYMPTSISAGQPVEVDAITSADKISIPDALMGKHAGNNNIYITKVNGESMNNVMQDGSLIAVKPVEVSELCNGDIVVFSDNGEYGVKRFYQQGNELLFRPDSSDFSFRDNVYTLDDCEGLEIHGKVVLYIVELD